MSSWHPVADPFDTIERHVARSSLHGHELVVWRADDGTVNVWENRCRHRGVRLSVGVNDGAELVCRYHAWRYASRSGGCTYIPAHPADSPARTVHCATFPVVERYGLVWATLDATAAGGPPEIDGLEEDPFLLRALPVHAPADLVLTELAASDGPSATTREPADGYVTIVAGEGADRETVVHLVQPVAAGRSVIRPVHVGTPADPVATRRRHARWLRRFVARLEAAAPPPAPAADAETPVPLPAVTGRDELVTVRIDRIDDTALGVRVIDLVEAGGAVLPAFQAGDHVDVHLPDGLIRQYSLTNAPGETDRYRIGVKRAPDSRGGSAYLHDHAAVGETLQVSVPVHGFPLRRNVPRTLLIAGGIGITPLLAMAQALHRVDLVFDLHVFAGSDAEVAFPAVLEGLGPGVHRHLGHTPEETGTAVAELLASPGPDVQLYVCGPPPMLDMIRRLAADAGWADDAVHFEYFENTTDIDRSSPFVVELARSALTVDVAGGESLLDAVRAVGVQLPSSCEQGACGSCLATVLEGEPHHQDVYLNAAEREAGAAIVTCVSRARSERLVLDL